MSSVEKAFKFLGESEVDDAARPTTSHYHGISESPSAPAQRVSILGPVFDFQVAFRWIRKDILGFLEASTINNGSTELSTECHNCLCQLYQKFIIPFVLASATTHHLSFLLIPMLICHRSHATHVHSLRLGVLSPVYVEIHGLEVPIFSIHFALLAVMSIVLPPNLTGTDLDYAYALLAVVGAWMTCLTQVFPAVITVVFPQSNILLCPDLQERFFTLGSSKCGPDATKKMMIQWRLARQAPLKKVIGQEWPFYHEQRVPQMSLSEISKLGRDSDRDILRLYARRPGVGHQGPSSIHQRFGDCAETIPLAIIANKFNGPTISILILPNIVKHIDSISHQLKIFPPISAIPGCSNCQLLFSAVECFKGLTVTDATSIQTSLPHPKQ